MSDKRKIRSDGEEIGLLSLDKLYRMVTRGDLDAPREFWSEKKESWLPLSGIMFDLQPSNIPAMRDGGVRKVSILGVDSSDCPACTAIQNKEFSIDEVPEIPPLECLCIPWCRLVVIAAS
jgi:hypothetical protein